MPTFLLPYMSSVAKLKEVNYARCVLDILGIVARKVKEMKRSGYSTCIVGGCVIVPQIFYVDSIDFGVHKAPANVLPRIKVYGKAKLDMLINMDKKSHNADLSQWYGNCKRNDEVNVEDKGKGVASRSRRPKKGKYMSNRQTRKQKSYAALMKVIEEQHADDLYLVEVLKRQLKKRKNLLLYRIADHMQNASLSDESDEETRSEVPGMEGREGGEQSFHDDAASGNPLFKMPDRVPRVSKDGSEEYNNISQVGEKREAEVPRNSGSQSSKRCKSTGPGDDARVDVEEAVHGHSAIRTEDTRNAETAGTVGNEDNNADIHCSIKIMVAQALGLLKDSCARPPGMLPVPAPKRRCKMVARRLSYSCLFICLPIAFLLIRWEQICRGQYATQLSVQKGTEENVHHDVETNNAEHSQNKNCEAGQIGDEDVIIHDVLKDIEADEQIRRDEGQEEPSVHVGSPVVDPKDAAVEGERREKESDAAKELSGGSESTNSGNVNDVLNSLCMTPQHNVQAPNAPIFDETPQCKKKDAVKFGENVQDVEPLEIGSECCMGDKDESDSSIPVKEYKKVYQRRIVSKTMYSTVASNPLISEGGRTI